MMWSRSGRYYAHPFYVPNSTSYVVCFKPCLEGELATGRTGASSIDDNKGLSLIRSGNWGICCGVYGKRETRRSSRQKRLHQLQSSHKQGPYECHIRRGYRPHNRKMRSFRYQLTCRCFMGRFKYFGDGPLSVQCLGVLVYVQCTHGVALDLLQAEAQVLQQALQFVKEQQHWATMLSTRTVKS